MPDPVGPQPTFAQRTMERQQGEAAVEKKLDAIFPKMQAMADNGAPPEVLMQYIQANGLTADDINRRAAELNLQKTTRGGAFGGFLRQMAQGATLGFADEAASGVKAAISAPFSDKTFGEIYDKELNENRAADAAMQTAHPVASMAAQIAGAAVPIIATAGAAAPAAAPTTVTGTVLRGASAGAGYGGLAGFGTSEGGFENRMTGAAKGAVVGGILGGAIPAGLAGGKLLIDKVRQALGSTNADDLAVSKVLQAMARDKLTPEDAAKQYLAALSADKSKPLTLADVGGENTRRLVDQSFLTPGKGAERATEFFAERQAGQGERILKDAGKFLPDENFYGMQDSLMTTRSVAAQPLYEAANAVPVKITARAARFLDDPVTQQAYEAGIKIQRLEAIARGKPFLNRAGEELIRNKPNFRMMTAVKEGLDDMIERYRDTTTGKLVLDKQGRALDEFRRAFVTELDRMNPKYAEARAAWAGPSAAMDALDMGRSVFNKDAEITVKTLRDMPESMKEFYKMGAFRAIADRVRGAADGADALKKFFNTPTYRARLSAVFGEDFPQFARLMETEKGMFKTAQSVLGNSKTAQRLAGAAEGDAEALNTVGQAVMGNWGAALRTLARKQIAKIGGMRPDVADRISEILLTGSPKEVMAALKGLQTGVRNNVGKFIPPTGGVSPAIAGASVGQFAGTAPPR